MKVGINGIGLWGPGLRSWSDFLSVRAGQATLDLEDFDKRKS